MESQLYPRKTITKDKVTMPRSFKIVLGISNVLNLGLVFLIYSATYYLYNYAEQDFFDLATIFFVISSTIFVIVQFLLTFRRLPAILIYISNVLISLSFLLLNFISESTSILLLLVTSALLLIPMTEMYLLFRSPAVRNYLRYNPIESLLMRITQLEERIENLEMKDNLESYK